METALPHECRLDSNTLEDSRLWVLVLPLDSTFFQDKCRTGRQQTSQNYLSKFQEGKETLLVILSLLYSMK